ncbi:MAG: anti-sigma factor family protein [Thermodesulfobacteriota bacterium]
MTEDCLKYAEHISQYLDGELDQNLSHKIQEHLQDCEDCRHCLQGLQKTIQLLQQKAPSEQVPEDIRARLRQRLMDCLQGKD